MPRKPRLVIPGYPHHIILRGNNKSAIFFNDIDKRFFINCLKESKKKTKSKIYSYCLMTNHVHMLIEPSSAEGLGNMIQSLGRKYVQNINKIHKRTGTLWEGRFKSSVVSTDEYLITCSRYIELNPVRAKMVTHPKDYPWTSYAFKAGIGQDGLVDEDPAYMSLGKTSEERQNNYVKEFERNIPPQDLSLIRHATQKGGIIGKKEFVEKIAKLTGRDVILKPRGRPKKSL